MGIKNQTYIAKCMGELGVTLIPSGIQTYPHFVDILAWQF